MKLAAVCAYFNPCGYKGRRQNYDVFRKEIEELGIELLTVELAFNQAPSTLGPHGNVITLNTGDVLWQKERLLQIGVDILRPDHDHIMWTDADVKFYGSQPVERIQRALESHDYVQCCDLLIKRYTDGDQRVPSAILSGQSSGCGGCWAGTAEFWEEVSFYTKYIVGGGDCVFLEGLQARYRSRHFPVEHPLVQDVLTWQKDLGSWSLGLVPDLVLEQLCHGSVQQRGYLNRFGLLEIYDPTRDVTPATGGGLVWTSQAEPALKAAVKQYFSSRREDN